MVTRDTALTFIAIATMGTPYVWLAVFLVTKAYSEWRDRK